MGFFEFYHGQMDDEESYLEYLAEEEYYEEQQRAAFEEEVNAMMISLSDELKLDQDIVFNVLAECYYDYSSAKELLIFRNDIYERCKNLENIVDKNLESFIHNTYQDSNMMRSIMSEKEFSFYQKDPEGFYIKENEVISEFDEELPF